MIPQVAHGSAWDSGLAERECTAAVEQMDLHGYTWMLAVLLSSILQQEGAATGQFTAAPPMCSGGTFAFTCNVTGDMTGFTTWGVGGNSTCTLSHASAGNTAYCGPHNAFTATAGAGFGTTSSSFSSTLSGTANSTLNGTLVECFGPGIDDSIENMVGNITLQTLGPPSVPTISCVGLSGDVSGAVNVTVNWTLSGEDGTDFYLINITTNAPQTPYGGLLNITTTYVTQYELTGFMAGYEYNITVRSICGRQEGGESELLTIRPQVPAAPNSCNITLSYDQLSKGLLFISYTWNTVLDPGQACPGLSRDIKQYQISSQTESFVNTTANTTVNYKNITACTAEKCSHTFNLSSDSVPSSYGSVSVAAENVVGVGTTRTCPIQPINTTNNLLVVQVEDVSSPNNVTINCSFLSEFNGSAHCTVQYGTDSSYMNLLYSAKSTEPGTAGDTVSVVLREHLNCSTEYYYTVSAVSGDVTVTMQGTFTTPQNYCSPMELWNLPAANATFQPNVSLLDDAHQYPNCNNRSGWNAVLVNTTLNTATIAYYNGTTLGSIACLVCVEYSGNEPNSTINERVCQSDEAWSKSTILCVCTLPCLADWHITLIAIGALVLVVGIVISIILMMVSCHRMDQVKWWHILLTVIATILCVPGVSLWIAVGVVLSRPLDGSDLGVCDQSWLHFHDRLIILAFMSSILAFIYAVVWGLGYVCCTKRGVKSKSKCPPPPVRSDEMQLQEAEPNYDFIRCGPPSPRAVPDPSDPGYSHLTEVSTALMYAEIGPHILPAAVTPPTNDSSVWYTSILHDESQSKQDALIPAGSSPINVDKISPPQSPIDTEELPPPIPPQQFSDEDIFLLPKLSENVKLQQDGRDTTPPKEDTTIPHQDDTTVPPLPPKANKKEGDLQPPPPKVNQEDTTVPPYPPKANKKEGDLQPPPPKVNQEDTTVPPLPPKANKKEGDLQPPPPKVNQEDTTVPPYPPKANKKEGDLQPPPPKVNQEDTTVPPLPPKANKKEGVLQPPPLKVNQEDTTVPPCPPKTNEENTTMILYTTTGKENEKEG